MFLGTDMLSSKPENVAEIIERSAACTAGETLSWALQRFGAQIAIVTSFQKEGMVILDMATRITPDVRVITIDTGRVHEETYAFMDEVREHYNIDIEVHFPESGEVRKLVSAHGMNLFYRDVEARQACCAVRKVAPLNRILADLDGWITGLRREQSAFRLSTKKLEIDDKHGGILKVNPLADWSEEDVDLYSVAHGVPQHPLYERGYRSIGCAPCTRAVAEDEDNRAGRWWWESGERKECGMHCRL